jgi:hypothetical protein
MFSEFKLVNPGKLTPILRHEKEIFIQHLLPVLAADVDTLNDTVMVALEFPVLEQGSFKDVHFVVNLTTPAEFSGARDVTGSNRRHQFLIPLCGLNARDPVLKLAFFRAPPFQLQFLTVRSLLFIAIKLP